MRKSLVKKIYKAGIVKGAGRGKRIGVPTINLDPLTAGDLKHGIYVCRVLRPFEYWGVMHFGPRPTYDDNEPSLEVYLFDFDMLLDLPNEIDLEIHTYI